MLTALSLLFIYRKQWDVFCRDCRN